MKKILAVIVIIAFYFSSQAQDKNLYEKKIFIQGNDTLLYRMLYPLNYKADKKYPLILFLHGSGERGSDNEAQLKWGGDLFLDSSNRVNFPAIVIFPQCPLSSSWVNIIFKETDSLRFSFPADQPPTKPMQLVIALINNMAQSGNVNSKQVYAGGLSMGGFGTFDILWRNPKLFAAAFPICGAGNPDKVELYASKFPIWVFHGGSDPVVPVGNSRLMVNALQKNGAKVKYTEYPGVGHDSWKNAFAEPGLLKWLFSNKK
jgi:predicted peptidase